MRKSEKDDVCSGMYVVEVSQNIIDFQEVVRQTCFKKNK